MLWHRVRAKRLGVKFKRQVPIGPFIPDFVCYSKRMIVEVDGDSHFDTARDRQRDQWFIDRGWFVLRFSGDDVRQDMDGVLRLLELALDNPSLIDDPLNLAWRG